MMYKLIQAHLTFAFLLQGLAEELTPHLVDGTDWSGRLEVVENGIRNTVCDHAFGTNEAQVVCRTLGLNSFGAVQVTSDMYGEGLWDTFSVQIKCTGAEKKLSDCKRGKLNMNHCNHSTDVGVICNIPGEITPRLVEGNVSSGRLEILYNGTWNLVCDEGFGLQEAEVTCRMLGFGSPREVSVMSLVYGNSSVTAISANVTCRGTERSLAECKHQGFYTNDCEKSMAVTISCSVPAELTLRLAIEHLLTRRLEVFYKQKWRSLCGYGFGQREAHVVCRMFNYSTWIIYLNSWYVRGSKAVRIADVNCTGTETSLFQCPNNGLQETLCSGTYYSILICNVTGKFALRFAGGTAWSGRLLIWYNGSWSSVCDDGFGHNEARVACRMLGFDSPDVFAITSFPAAYSSLYLFNERKMLLSDLDCQGTETDLAQCNYSILHNQKCSHGREVALVCKVETEDIRLTGSYATTHGVGRVEMRMKSKWFSLCGTGFSNEDARVVCRQLGFNSSTATTADASLFGVIQREVVVVDFSCSGNETTMFICLQKIKKILDMCDTEEFGVICGEYPPSIMTFSLNSQVGPTVTVSENSSVDILCESHGRPTPRMLLITDNDNHHVLESTHEDVQQTVKKRQITMFLKEVQCQDTANYRCEVYNGLGQSNQSIRLFVPCAPRLQSVNEQLPSVKISNYKGSLSFRMTANPAPRVKFIVHHGSAINNSVDVLSVKENVHVQCTQKQFAPASHTCMIRVDNVSAAHQGVYQVVFSNDLGEISFNFTVGPIVLKRQDCTQPLMCRKTVNPR